MTSLSVLLTGAAGFVGKYVLSALLAKGHRLTVLQHRTLLPPDLRARCDRVLTGDLCDPAVQDQALSDVEAICHLSAYVPARMDDLGEAEACFRINAKAVLGLASRAAKRGVRRFVHFSTGNMYAPSSVPCDESASVFPTGYGASYFASKLLAEVYLSTTARQSSVEVVILRVGSPYGPGEPENKVIPVFLRRTAESEPLHVKDGGVARYNFVHVADVAELAARAVAGGPAGIYNVAAGEHTSVLELARMIAPWHPAGPAAVHAEPATRGAFEGFPGLAVDKARMAFGFDPRPLREGLDDYWSRLFAGKVQP
jgi:UDP-glucose 4-epimerase